MVFIKFIKFIKLNLLIFKDGVTFSPFTPENVKTFAGGCMMAFKVACTQIFNTIPIINISYL